MTWTNKDFQRGYICALCILYEEFPYLADEVIYALGCNGFTTYADAMEVDPDEMDVENLRRLFGVDAND